MTVVQSKFKPISTCCREYIHPWTDSCVLATLGLADYSFKESLRIYTAVYIFSLLTKFPRIPKIRDIERTVKGILRSSAFLATSAWGFPFFNCAYRALFGHMTFLSVAFLPSFLTGIAAILMERSSRRQLLALYVANVGSEAFWNMMVSRGLVKSTQTGQLALLGFCLAVLLYYYKKGYHMKLAKESVFDILRFVVGEVGSPNEMVSRRPPRRLPRTLLRYKAIVALVKVYRRMVERIKHLPRNKCCPHPHSCVYYNLSGSLKLFGTGLGIQLGLKLLFQMKRFIRNPKSLFTRENLRLSLFMGGFSAIFRALACLIRTGTGEDTPIAVILPAIAGSVAFNQYPDNSILLYIMWKMLQISFLLGVQRGYWNSVPGFTEFFYCFWTAILFHTALLEPNNIRPSYWRFLHSLSGGRVAIMDRKPLDVWGLKTSEQLEAIMKRTNTRPELKMFLVRA